MSKVSVDSSACVGCGLCEQLCPEVFKLNSEGIAEVRASECKQHDLSDIASQCPANAIKID